MISFLNGLLLPALAAASIPIILHFLSKKKTRKIPFSSTRFLKVIENQRIKRVKLYQLLLILVRTLFIIFLVLAFSRPTISTSSADFSNAQTTAFIILDDSYSMQAYANSNTYFEIAKEKLIRLLSSFKKDDTVLLYRSSMDKVFPVSPLKESDILAGLKAGNSILDLAKCFIVADSVFKNHVNLNNEIYFLSDFKFPEEQAILKTNKNLNYKVFKIPLDDNSSFKNVSVDTVIIEDQLFELNKPFEISVNVTNHNAEPIETSFNLFDSDERVGMDLISLDGNETKTFKTSFTAKSSGIHNLLLKLDEDDLSLDNNWFFSITISNVIETLFITDQPSLQIQTALDIIEENTPFHFSLAGYNELLGIGLNSFDLIILNNLTEINQPAAVGLQEFINLEKSIVIIPGDPVSIENYSHVLKTLSGKTISAQLESATGSGFYSIENQKSANIIFDALFRDKSSTFSPPKVFKYIKLNIPGHPLIQLSNDDPYLTQLNNLLIFSASFNRAWTDIEINGLFLPLLYRTFFYATRNNSSVSKSLNVGNKIVFKLENNSVSENYKIHSPQSIPLNVIPEPVANFLHFKGGLATEPGFYFLLKNDLPVTTITVNHSSKELKKPYIDNDLIMPGLILMDSEDFIDEITSHRLGYELWFIFLVLTFLMVLCEIALIKLIEGTSFLKRA